MFKNRIDAGQKLAKALKPYEKLNPIILALPRGGVPIGTVVSKALQAPLDVLVVRKIGAPWNPEFGVGAMTESILIFDEETLKELDLTHQHLQKTIEEEKIELTHRIELYREGKEFPDVKGRVVILIDDGLATGITTMAAIKSIKQMKPKSIVLAIPVGPSETIEKLRKLVDDIICLEIPPFFHAVGEFYKDFPQVTDKEVIQLLKNQTAA